MNARPAELPRLEAEAAEHLGRLADALQHQLEQRESLVKAIRDEIADLKKRLESVEAIRHSFASGTRLLKPVAATEHPTKPRAVLGFLSAYPNRSFKLLDIRTALIERGLMGSDRASIHALEVAVRHLHQRGQVERPRTGYYRIPAGDGGETGKAGLTGS